MTLSRLHQIWGAGEYLPIPVAAADLSEVERRLGLQFPADYRRAVLQSGLPRLTIALLDAIVDRELDLYSLNDFFLPAEIVAETIAWREIGMPAQLVAFANDYCGNKFCFDADRIKNASADASAIWFYDHDFGTVDSIAASFTDWIEAYCRVEPLPQPDRK